MDKMKAKDYAHLPVSKETKKEVDKLRFPEPGIVVKIDKIIREAIAALKKQKEDEDED